MTFPRVTPALPGSARSPAAENLPANVQSVLATVLQTLIAGAAGPLPACARQRALLGLQLRYLQDHPASEAFTREVAGELLQQLEDQGCRDWPALPAPDNALATH